MGDGAYVPELRPKLPTKLSRISRNFKSSLHLLAWKIGAWTVKMLGAQTAMSLVWIINFLVSIANELHIQREAILDIPSDYLSETEGSPPPKKRGRHL